MAIVDKVIIADPGGTIVDVTAANALKTDSSHVTQPVSASALPLPTGAATEATVASIDGKTPALSGGKVPVTDPTALPLPSGASTSANQTTGNASLASIDGKLPATIGQKTMAASLPVVIASDQGALTVASHAVTNAGTFATQATLAAETTKVIGTVNVAAAQTIAVTQATGSNLKAEVTNAGTFVTQSTLAAETTKVIGTVNVAAAQTIAVTNAGTFAAQATLTPLTTGGLTTYHLVSAGSTNATVIKNSAGQVYGWYIFNNAAAIRKVAFHNASSTPTAGASIFMSLVIPPGSGANVEFTMGIPFSTGISITTVTGVADNDTAAVTANDLIINIFYK